MRSTLPGIGPIDARLIRTDLDARVAAVILAIAAALRLIGYLQNTSLWLDEAALAWNLIHVDLAGLAMPLPFYEQAAPLGFLLLSKMSGLAGGYSELSLRLVPLSTGIASVWLTYRVLRPAVGPAVALIAMALCAISPLAIQYSLEFKHYGVEMFATLVAVHLWHKLLESPPDPRRALFAGGAGVCLLALSFTVIIVMFSAGLAALIMTRRDLWSFRYAFLAFAIWAAAFIVYYFAFVQPTTAAQFQVYDFYFNEGYASADSSIADMVVWHASHGARIVSSLFLNTIEWPEYLRSIIALPLAILMLVGLISLWRRAPKAGLLISIFGVTLYALSLLRLFPLLPGRYVLFLLPFASLLLAEGMLCSWIAWRGHGASRRTLVSAFLALLLLPVAYMGTSRALVPQREELRPLVDYILRRPDATLVVVHHYAQPAFDYYTRGRRPETIGTMASETGAAAHLPILANYDAYVADILRGLADQNDAWILFSHAAGDQDKRLLEALRTQGTSQLVKEDVGAKLYRFTRSPGDHRG